MKVTSVEVDVLQVPVARPYSAGGRQVTSNWHVLARVTTSAGVQGHGYIVALRQGLVAAVAQATRELSTHLVGMHVLEVAIRLSVRPFLPTMASKVVRS